MRIALAIQSSIQGRGGVEQLVRSFLSGFPDSWNKHLVSTDASFEMASSGGGATLVSHFPYQPGQEAKVLEWLLSHQISICHFHLSGTFGGSENSGVCRLMRNLAKAGIICLTTNHQAISPCYSNMVNGSALHRIVHFARRWPGKFRQLSAVRAEVLVSKHDYRLTTRWFPWQRKKMSAIYHSRIETRPLCLPPSQRERSILCLATICFRKGQDILADAFSRIAAEFPDWQLRLVGAKAETACVEKISSLAVTCGLEDRIMCEGASDRPDSELAQAGIYVQPSLLEGLGLSLQEAMWHGLPCIGSKVGGIPELIDSDAAGILVPPRNAEALAQALRELLSSESKRRKLGVGARSSMEARRMDRQSMIANYMSLYAEMA